MPTSLCVDATHISCAVQEALQMSAVMGLHSALELVNSPSNKKHIDCTAVSNDLDDVVIQVDSFS